MAAEPETENGSSFEIVTRHIVMERDLNAFGNLFGGIMLAWLDEASALYVMDKIGFADFVTVSLDNVNFRTPARRGDAVVLYSRIQKVGRSSITIQSRALVHEPVTGKKEEIIDCRITFVCLKDGKPFAYFETPAYRRWTEGQQSSGQ